MDKALREVRGVSLQQPLDKDQMGYAPPQNPQQLEHSLIASMNEQDGHIGTKETSSIGLKFPNIAQESEFTRGGSIKNVSQSMSNQLQGAIISYGQGTQALVNTKVVSVAGTSHRFNVTIGENDQFIHTTQDGHAIA